MSEKVELLIAGGGLNGMLLGIACADAGLQVAVVDRQDPATMLGDKFDGRTSAVAYGSKLVLEGVGLWPLVAAEADDCYQALKLTRRIIRHEDTVLGRAPPCGTGHDTHSPPLLQTEPCS